MKKRVIAILMALILSVVVAADDQIMLIAHSTDSSNAAGSDKCSLYNDSMILNIKSSMKHKVLYNLSESDDDVVKLNLECSEIIILGGKVI